VLYQCLDHATLPGCTNHTDCLAGQSCLHTFLPSFSVGVCLAGSEAVTCAAARDCPGPELSACCGGWCCPQQYRAQLASLACVSSLQCRQWGTGEFCCPDSRCCPALPPDYPDYYMEDYYYQETEYPDTTTDAAYTQFYLYPESVETLNTTESEFHMEKENETLGNSEIDIVTFNSTKVNRTLTEEDNKTLVYTIIDKEGDNDVDIKVSQVSSIEILDEANETLSSTNFFESSSEEDFLVDSLVQEISGSGMMDDINEQEVSTENMDLELFIIDDLIGDEFLESGSGESDIISGYGEMFDISNLGSGVKTDNSEYDNKEYLERNPSNEYKVKSIVEIGQVQSSSSSTIFFFNPALACITFYIATTL